MSIHYCASNVWTHLILKWPHVISTISSHFTVERTDTQGDQPPEVTVWLLPSRLSPELTLSPWAMLPPPNVKKGLKMRNMPTPAGCQKWGWGKQYQETQRKTQWDGQCQDPGSGIETHQHGGRRGYLTFCNQPHLLQPAGFSNQPHLRKWLSASGSK